MPRRLLASLLVILLAGTATVARIALDRRAGDAPEGLLYLPNGKHLKVMSLGHASLLADVLFLWAIQYYSNYEREDRYVYVEHVFDTVITELDPHYIDAYWIGALILIIEAGQLEPGIRLLLKGADRNPDEWILPYLAGWESYHARQYERAEQLFERAARVPDAPAAVRRMRAGMLLKSGNLREALTMWQALLDDPNSDAQSLRIAARKVRELRVRIDIQLLRTAIDRFRNDNGRNPRRLEELIVGAYIGQLPRDPDGAGYVYDPQDGTVSSPAGRVFGDN